MKHKITSILLFIMTSLVTAQTITKIKGNLPNTAYYSALKDNYLYIASTFANIFERYDLNDLSAAPVSFSFSNSQNMIRIHGEHLYFASFTGNNISRRPLTDLSTSSSEEVISLNRAVSLDFNGDYMYVIDSENGIFRYDMSASIPQNTETLIVAGYGFRDLKVVNNSLYFISSSILYKKDLSTLSTTDEVQLVHGLGVAQAIVQRGNNLYISQFHYGGDILKYDMVTDTQTTFVASTEFDISIGLAIKNDTMYFVGNQNTEPFESALFSVDLMEDTHIQIPDVNFEQALIDLGHDTGSVDGFIAQANANNIVQLNVNNKGINSLEGIRHFLYLETLYAQGNNISTLDLRFVNNTSHLKKLYLAHNDITTLNIENNLGLEELYIPYNELTDLDLSNHVQLTLAYVNYNELSTIGDLSNLTGLQYLFVNNNAFSSIDVSNNTALEVLNLENNAFVNLDLSANNLLEEVNVSFNPNLTALNLKNGNNTIISDFASGGTPNLTCIEVDDPSYSTTNWISRDQANTFSTACNVSELCSFDSNDNGIITTANFQSATQNINIGTGLGHDVGQSFIACDTGTLASIGVLMINTSGSNNAYDLTIRVYEGSGNSGTLLGTVSNLSATDATVFTDRSIFDMSSANIQVTQGSSYTFYISSPHQTVNSRITNGTIGSIYTEGSVYNAATAYEQDLLFSVSIQDNSTLGIGDVVRNTGLTVFPNPTNNTLHIKGLKGEHHSYKVYDLLGKVVIQGKTHDNVHLGTLSSGVYLLNIEGFKPVRVLKK